MDRKKERERENKENKNNKEEKKITNEATHQDALPTSCIAGSSEAQHKNLQKQVLPKVQLLSYDSNLESSHWVLLSE